MGHTDLGAADAPDATSAAQARVIVCGDPSADLRTLLAAVEREEPRLRLDLANGSGDAPSLAQELLTGPPVRCALVGADVAGGVPPALERDLRLLVALGVEAVVVAVTGVERAGDPEAAYRTLREEALSRAAALGVETLRCVPVPHGQELGARSARPAPRDGRPLSAELLELARPPEGAGAPPRAAADRFRATVVWLGRQPLLRGRAYRLRLGATQPPAGPRTQDRAAAAAEATATVAPVKYRLDLDTGEHAAATTLARGEAGVCELELPAPVAYATYREHPEAGRFLLEDRLTGATVGIGTITFALRRAENVRWQTLEIGKAARAAALGQRPTVVWLTGLSGAGKSTIANLVEGELHARGHHTYLLDGDNVRHGLNSDLGFTAADRVENIRRVAEVARLMADAGLIVIVSFISPFRAEREMARSLLEPGEFLEIHVDAPLDVVEQRDPKGLYRKARRGELRNFTGIDSPYEAPESPDLRLETALLTPAAAAARVVEALERRGRLQAPSGRTPERA